MNTPAVTKKGMFAKAAASIDEAPPMRPQMRDDDPRARAAKRAAELRNHLEDDLAGSLDEFYIDQDMVPDGWTYEWKRHTVFGAEDPSYQVHLARMGWTPVQTSRHPQMMPHSTTETYIMRKGMILMECPTEIVEERRAFERKKARDQVRAKEEQLAGTPDGTLTRDHRETRPKIKKSYEPMPIPE